MTRWYNEKKKEHYYKEAKKVGYRARSAFKLKQIQKKFNILNKGDCVLDLGAAPGSWSQVAKGIVGDDGIVVGIDISSIKPISGIVFLKGDMTKETSVQEILKIVGENKADVVISDMSPDISGNYIVDHARSIFLSQQAFETAKIVLKPGGHFVCKVFSGEDLDDFVLKIKNNFKKVKSYSPPASRDSSSEIYIIAKSFIN